MKTSDFDFELPEELIAQVPAEKRGADRLLVLDKETGEFEDRTIDDFPSYVEEGSIVVVNNSKVRKARIYGTSKTGGVVEFLLMSCNADGTWVSMVSKSKKQKVGKTYTFDGDVTGEIASENEDGTKNVRFTPQLDEQYFLDYGHVPLPPYIKREDCFSDESRYQTVYAKKEGSVAAPTAGLHFTRKLMDEIREKGVEILEVTLHVGAGTFLPVRTENLEDHNMHYEWYEISQEVADKINQAKKEGRKIYAVGTTSVRTLESAADKETGLLRAGLARTNLFIKPGYKFQIVDRLLTNFHTPESTLLVLVSSLAGRENILNAYRHAVEERYHFYSYGDAMLIK